MESKAKGVVGRYNQFVLEGTWVDERSTLPPSIIADQGFRLYQTKNQADYGRAPDLAQELTYPRFKPRHGMLTAATWNEASYAYGGGPEALRAVLLGGKKGFNATHAGRDMTKAEVAATFTTTARQAAISGIQVSAAAAVAAAAATATLARTSLVPGAGGKGFLAATDRGKAIVGVSGEVIRQSSDARYDTEAQRSWIGRPDAGLGASRRVRWGWPGWGWARRLPRCSAARPHSLSLSLPPLPPSLSLTTRAQAPAPRAEVTWMSPPGVGGGDGSPTRAQGPTNHGKFAAFAAPGVKTTDISVQFGRPPPGRRVFLDDP